MATIKMFDTAEEMFEELRKNREAADAQIAPWQRGLKPGDCVVRVAEFGGERLVIYGELVDPVELDRPHYDLDDPESREEFECMKERYTSPEWLGSFRFGRFYSPLCSEGELGDIHLATVTLQITREYFEAARAADWPQALPVCRPASA